MPQRPVEKTGHLPAPNLKEKSSPVLSAKMVGGVSVVASDGPGPRRGHFSLGVLALNLTQAARSGGSWRAVCCCLPSIVPPRHYFSWWLRGAGVSIVINS